jgi:hypothetical protein
MEEGSKNKMGDGRGKKKQKGNIKSGKLWTLKI